MQVKGMQNANLDLFCKNDRIIAAISGGIDSMVLLHWLVELRDKLNLDIIVCHVNHNRRLESKNEAIFVKENAEKYQLPFILFDYHYTENGNFHHAARKARYDFFHEIAKTFNATKIVLAHQADDLAETILMRLVRGSSLAGYAGIREKARFRDIEIVRPLLGVSREEIILYQQKHDILYMEDNSNQSDAYTRNRFRHQVIPLLKQENPKYIDKFLQFSEYLECAHDYIETEAEKYLATNVAFTDKEAGLSRKSLLTLPKIIRYEILKLVIDRISKDKVEVSYSQFQDLDQMINEDKPHLEIDIANDITALKSYDAITVAAFRPATEEYEYTIGDFGETPLSGGYSLLISKNNSNLSGKYHELWYNDLDLVFPLKIRNRRPGDRVSLPGGTKKLKSVFIDRKVPHLQRDRLPLVFDRNGKLLWIPMIHKQKTEGEKCLYLVYRKGIDDARKGY